MTFWTFAFLALVFGWIGVGRLVNSDAPSGRLGARGNIGQRGQSFAVVPRRPVVVRPNAQDGKREFRRVIARSPVPSMRMARRVGRASRLFSV